VLTALVVDESPTARAQVTGLLELAGWGVHEAGDAEDARWLSAELAVDLVVTSATVLGATSGPALLDELRAAGSTARFLVTATDPTAELRAAAAAAGALACLSGPLDARLLLDLLRRRSATPAGSSDLVDPEDLDDADQDAELTERLQTVYDRELPGRFSAIDRGARAGDPQALADAAFTLAGTSGQLGHPDVADVCQAIAADARRGVLAHSRVSELAGLAGVDRRVADRRQGGRGDRAEPRGTRERRTPGTDRRTRPVTEHSAA
jgi:DNA-binding NarL/FixJ family response regulator